MSQALKTVVPTPPQEKPTSQEFNDGNTEEDTLSSSDGNTGQETLSPSNDNVQQKEFKCMCDLNPCKCYLYDDDGNYVYW